MTVYRTERTASHHLLLTWMVKYCEHYFPDMTENLSSCKSPQQMFGAIAKSYYAEKAGIDPKDIVSVSVMPCTAKKFEDWP